MTFNLAMAQLNPRVGDVAGNTALVRAARAEAMASGAAVVVTSELAISGYPPEDLVLRPAFLADVRQAVETLAAETNDGGPALIVTAPWVVEGKTYNAALVCDEGRVQAAVLKHHLPNYGVFDEIRVFAAGPLPTPVTVRGVSLGILICEDMWFADVAGHLAAQGADILVVPNGSPWEIGKHEQRLAHVRSRVTESGLPLVYVNQVGGQDELVFDGDSFIVAADQSLAVRGPAWQSAVVVSEWQKTGAGTWQPVPHPLPAPLETLANIYQAMVVGLRDYVEKTGFPGVILGLSGGIDSAISAAVAVDALGAKRVWCVMMPSPYTSVDSLEDAAQVAKLLGTRLDDIDIGPAMQAFSNMLEPLFIGKAPDITEENLQSRSRGLTLMALSNKFGPMVLSTGNKSEMGVGYATLYGDMCGGYSVLKDVYKMTVFALSHWRNANKPEGALGPDGPVMPERVITKPPSAELRPDQKDEDSLPPYAVLDDILESLIERQEHVAEIVEKRGYDRATVERVWRLLNRAEYKRRQAPPGVKITGRAFGRERRYPIVNGWNGSKI